MGHCTDNVLGIFIFPIIGFQAVVRNQNAIWQVIGGKLIEMYTVVIISVNAVVTIQFIHIRIFLARSNYHGKHE
jgi:hypothetical protein